MNTKRKLSIKFNFNWFVIYMFMIALVIFTSLPLVYMVSTAFKPLDELFVFPPRFLVRRPTLQNFAELAVALSSSTIPFTRYVFNSLFITLVNVSGTVLVSCMGAYALAKLKVPLSGFLFKVIIAALMFSPHVTAIPSYMVVNGVGLIDTYWALIIPKIAVAYNLFLIKQFAEQIPDSLLESARMDGAREWMVFWKIAMPMLKPAISTLVVLSFVSNWNDYFSALIYLSNPVMKVLPLAVQTIGGGSANIARAGAMAAVTLLTIAPTIILFVFMQSKVIRTMAHSGIKG